MVGWLVSSMAGWLFDFLLKYLVWIIIFILFFFVFIHFNVTCNTMLHVAVAIWFSFSIMNNSVEVFLYTCRPGQTLYFAVYSYAGLLAAYLACTWLGLAFTIMGCIRCRYFRIHLELKWICHWLFSFFISHALIIKQLLLYSTEAIIIFFPSISFHFISFTI